MTTSVRAVSKEAIHCFGNSTRQLDAVNVHVTHDTRESNQWRRPSLASPGSPVGQPCVTRASQLLIQELKN